MKRPTLLFLCTGNYFRSRFAEILFNHRAEQAGIGWDADSRGIAVDLGAGNIGEISANTRERLDLLGIRLPSPLRFPIQLTETDLVAARHIVAVKEAEHRPLLEHRFPGWADLVEYWHIHDVDCCPPEQALTELETAVAHLLRRLGAHASHR